MNNTNLRESVLASIDGMNSVIQEAEFDVLASLIETTDKAVSIMENYSGDDISMFSIFQEAEVQDGDPKDAGDAEAKKSWLDVDKNEGVIMKILKFIPRLLRMLFGVIKKAWTGDIQPAVSRAVETAKNIPGKAKDLIDKIFSSDEDADIKGILTAAGISVATIAAITGIIMAMRKINKDIKAKMDAWISNTKNFFQVLKDKDINPVWRISIKNSTVRTNLDINSFDTMISDDMKALLNEAASFDVSHITSYDPVIAKYKKLQESGAKIAGLRVIGDEAKEYSFDEIKGLFDKMGASIPPVLELAKKASDVMEKAADSPFFKKTDNPNADNDNGKKEELTKLLNDGTRSLKDTVKIMNYSLDLTKSLGMSLSEYVEKAKELSEKIENETPAAEGSDSTSDTNTTDGGSEESTISDDGSGGDDESTPSSDTSSDEGSSTADEGTSSTGSDGDSASSEGSGSEKTYKKGNKVSAEEALKVLQSAGGYQKWSVSNGKLVGKEGKKLSVGTTYGDATKELMPGVYGVKVTDDGYILESYVDIDDDGVGTSSNSWYNM